MKTESNRFVKAGKLSGLVRRVRKAKERERARLSMVRPCYYCKRSCLCPPV